MNFSELEKYDSQKMFEVYDKWPRIAQESFESEQNEINFDNINHIVFAGMGGSGAIGDVLKAILSKSKIHVNVVKGYTLPKTVDSNSLVISTSASGNTVETLTVLNSAKKLGCKTMSFSSGGNMEKYCKNNNLGFQKVAFYNSPRASFVSYLFSMLKTLEKILQLKISDVRESISYLEKLKENISSKNLTSSNPAINLAEWITGIPLIYYPYGLQAAAIRFKNSLQENSKIHAMSEDAIEACHNGIVAWEKSSNVQPILLQGNDDYFKTKERWKILKDYFKENEINFWEINSVEGSILSKLVNMVYLLDYSSIYKGIMIRTDPTPVNAIDFIKKRL